VTQPPRHHPDVYEGRVPAGGPRCPWPAWRIFAHAAAIASSGKKAPADCSGASAQALSRRDRFPQATSNQDQPSATEAVRVQMRPESEGDGREQ